MNYFRRALRFTACKCETEDRTHAFARRKVNRAQGGLAHLRSDRLWRKNSNHRSIRPLRDYHVGTQSYKIPYGDTDRPMKPVHSSRSPLKVTYYYLIMGSGPVGTGLRCFPLRCVPFGPDPISYFSRAALMNSRNKGCGLSGLDLNSGWYWTATKNGWFFSSTISTRFLLG